VKRKKKNEKMNYMHFSPVKRSLAASPKDWAWSSCNFYWRGQQSLRLEQLQLLVARRKTLVLTESGVGMQDVVAHTKPRTRCEIGNECGTPPVTVSRSRDPV